MTKLAGGIIDIGDFPSTDWTPITLAAGLTNLAGYTLAYALEGKTVWLRGRVAGLVAATNTVLNDPAFPLPVGCRPGIPTWDLGIIANGASTKARVWITSDGNISVRTDSGTQGWVFGSFRADA